MGKEWSGGPDGRDTAMSSRCDVEWADLEFCTIIKSRGVLSVLMRTTLLESTGLLLFLEE